MARRETEFHQSDFRQTEFRRLEGLQHRVWSRPRRHQIVIGSCLLLCSVLGIGSLDGQNAPIAEKDAPLPKHVSLGGEDARHLLSRTGFGSSIGEIQTIAQLSRSDAVDSILSSLVEESLLPEPAFLQIPRSDRVPGRGISREERQQFQRQARRHGQELQAWWTAEMVFTDSPFTERLVLFWHNHFVSEQRKVRDPELMWQQNGLFRKHAAGNFREFLRAVTLDAAMVIYLDTQQNQRQKPNENYARELLELFTLGEGHYSETDVKEAARALTGWRVDRSTGSVQYVARRHDRGTKTFMDVSGRHTADDILRILLEKERVSEFIVESLWHEFISPEPQAEEVERLAEIFRASEYELKPLYREILLSSAFWNPLNRGALIKSPIDVVVGTARLLRLEDVPPQSLSRASAGLGQSLFNPPNVKGWPGHDRWITSSSLLGRRQFLERALVGLRSSDRRRAPPPARPDQMEPEMDPEMDPDRVDRDRRRPRQRGSGRRGPMRRNPPMEELIQEWSDLGATDSQRAIEFAKLLLPLSPVIPQPSDERPLETLKRLLLDPTYQLK